MICWKRHSKCVSAGLFLSLISGFSWQKAFCYNYIILYTTKTCFKLVYVNFANKVDDNHGYQTET